MTDPLNPIDSEQKFEPLTPADTPPSQWRRWHLPVLAIFAIASYVIITRQNAPAPYQRDEGTVFGTFYHITYQAKLSLKDSIEARLKAVDHSLSMFNPASTISRINSGQSAQTDSLFRIVFRLAQQVSEATGGAFDITVAPLVNAWGFGFKSGTLPDSAAVDSLRALVGWQHVRLCDDGTLQRDDPRTILDCSAIAKGFGVDVVASYLRARGINNYMVEIGGEVVVSGVNPKGEQWRVGINRPVDDPESTSSELATVLTLTDCAMATSGNYRNYYTTDDGRRVAHTIDPSTGYPVQHSILSATVVAPTCAVADAFATSFMVVGLDSARAILARHPELSVYLICDNHGTNTTFSTITETHD